MRTGDRATDGAIARWLQDHGVEVTHCADSYEACVVALSQDGPPPDVAFIGADWLAPDETAIIAYFHESWPELPIVVHGSARATSGFHSSKQTRVCRSPEVLRHMLADSPDALTAEHRVHAPVSPLSEQPDPRQVVPTIAPRLADLEDLEIPRPTIRTQDAEPPAAECVPRITGLDTDAPPALGTPATHDILTREELEALLADDE